MTSVSIEDAFDDASDLLRLVYKPCIISNMSSVSVMQQLHTRVAKV